ncbi:hypothetical protein ACFLRY_05595 [Bacteroidota bacterium]
MKKYSSYLLLLLIALYLSGCSNTSSRKAYYNEDIQLKTSNSIKTLDKIVLEAIQDDNPALLTSLLSSNLRKSMSPSRIDSNINYVHTLLGGKDFEYLDQIYIPNTATLSYDSIGAGFGENKYYVYYEPYNKEVFISLLYPKHSFDEFLITLIYSKYSSGWKLDVIKFGVWKVLSKNAIDYYKESLEFYSKGHFIDASNALNIMWQCIRPAGKYYRYYHDDDMVNMLDFIRYEIQSKYEFPIAIDTNENSATIFNIYPYRLNGIYYPMIQYFTNVKLYDFAGLEKENLRLQQRIENIFPGITLNNPIIYYRAYNEIPKGSKRVMHYGFQQIN